MTCNHPCGMQSFQGEICSSSDLYTSPASEIALASLTCLRNINRPLTYGCVVCNSTVLGFSLIAILLSSFTVTRHRGLFSILRTLWASKKVIRLIIDVKKARIVHLSMGSCAFWHASGCHDHPSWLPFLLYGFNQRVVKSFRKHRHKFYANSNDSNLNCELGNIPIFVSVSLNIVIISPFADKEKTWNQGDCKEECYAIECTIKWRNFEKVCASLRVFVLEWCLQPRLKSVCKKSQKSKFIPSKPKMHESSCLPCSIQ